MSDHESEIAAACGTFVNLKQRLKDLSMSEGKRVYKFSLNCHGDAQVLVWFKINERLDGSRNARLECFFDLFIVKVVDKAKLEYVLGGGVFKILKIALRIMNDHGIFILR